MAPAIDSVIALLLVSAFVVILNETIMGVALPHLMADLDITASAAQWLTTAFMLTMAVVDPGHRISVAAAQYPAGIHSRHVAVQRRYADFGAGAGVRNACHRPDRAGLGDGDHDAAADDDGDDLGAAGIPRQDHGQHLGCHFGCAGDRTDHFRH